MKTKTLLFSLSLLLALVSCDKTASQGNLTLLVSHEVDGQPLVTDTLCYVNEAGNHYLVNEVQWFISKVRIQNEQGEWHDFGDAFYIDTDLPESCTLESNGLPVGHYTSVQFTFGFSNDDNQSGRFNDPPECNMFWPDELGGGYHYMKLNGKYLNADSLLAPMAIHLGIGQNADFTSFYDNSFVVDAPIDFDILEEQASTLCLTMNIEQWFTDPNCYDILQYGSAIMQNQEAQQVLKENGHNVFSIKNPQDMRLSLKTTVQLIHKAAPQPHFMTWENVKSTLEDIIGHKNPQ